MIYVGIDPSLESTALFIFDSESHTYEYHSFFVTHDGKLQRKRQRVIEELSGVGINIHIFVDNVDRSKVKHAKLQSDSNTKKQADAVCGAIKDILQSGSSLDDLSEVLDNAHKDDLEVYQLMAENDLSRFSNMKSVSLEVRETIISFCKKLNKNEVVIAIEAPAYVASGSSSVDLIAGCAFIRDVPNTLLEDGVTVNNTYMLPPTSVKKHATGRGTATKEEMCEAFTRKGPNDAFRELVSTVATKDYKPMDDIVDAYFMAYFVAEDILSMLS